VLNHMCPGRMQERERAVDAAFARHLETVVAREQAEAAQYLEWRMTELQRAGDATVDELTEALRTALGGGTPGGWLRV
jgi:hypothetical protein